MKAILLSGGLDSTCLIPIERPERAVFVDYGQRCAVGEYRAATAVAARLGVPLSVTRVDCRALGSGDLSSEPPVKQATHSDWWPYRNQLLVTIAAAALLRDDLDELLVGSVRTDGEQHLDGSVRFFELLDQVMRYQEGGVAVRAPGITMTTPELIAMSELPPGLLAWTHSCHTSDVACGSCRGCAKRVAVLHEAGLDLLT